MAQGGKGVKIFTPLGRIDENIGYIANASHMTVRKVEKILREGSEDTKQKARSGDLSIDYAYKSVKREQDHTAENIPKLPEGQFSIILDDPPWSYNINTRGSPDEHYSVMAQQDIESLKIPAADNAMLYYFCGPQIQNSPKL